MAAFARTLPCPYCHKMNPVPEDELGVTSVCQWCHRKYAYGAAGFAEAIEPDAPAPPPAASQSSAPAGPITSCQACGAENADGARYCSACGVTIPEPDALAELAALKADVRMLRGELAGLESRLPSRKLPNTALLSDSFWTRAWAVWGHSFATGAFIYGALLLLSLLLWRR